VSDSCSSTNSSDRLLVAVCTYNERQNLPLLVDKIHDLLPTATIVVVDDDSPDGTGQWVAEAAEDDPRLQCIIRSNQRGLGGALRTAILWAIDHKFDWMLNLDADHSHDPCDLVRLLDQATSTAPPLDCVVGTRYADGGGTPGWPRHRQWMSRAVNRFATGVLRLPVSDCSGSLRCYRVDALRAIRPESLRSNGYAVFEEILVRLRRSGARFGEVPITFHQRHSGDSKLSATEALKAAWQITKLVRNR
jgi:dolichol-phosphate mannosyltransferase